MTDLRYGARILRRNPVFALTATLSLAIGVGATTAIFSVANGLLLRAAPGVEDSSSLVDIVARESSEPGVTPIAYDAYRELRRQADTLAGVYAGELDVQPLSLRVESTGAERVFGMLVTTNYFDVLGVRAVAGRTFSTADSDAPEAAPVIVLAYCYWMQRFKGDPSVIGRTVHLNGYPMTIVGVVAEEFRGTGVLAPDVWAPTGMAAVVHPERGEALLSGGSPWLMAGGRLKPGVSRAQASAQIAAIGRTLARDAPPQAPMPGGRERAFASLRWSVETASPIPYGLRLVAAGFLSLLMAIVFLVLVIACANVSGVLLARATARRREIAVRTALGAGRRRIVGQLLSETLLLFVLGGVTGLLLARGFTTLLLALLPVFPLPVALSVPLDVRVMLFAFALTAAAALISGLAPALHASKADVVSGLKTDAQTATKRSRLRSGFIVAQVAFSTLLVITAGLLGRGLGNVRAVDHGFDVANVDSVSLDLSMARYTAATTPAFTSELLRRARALPGVSSATLVDHPPGPAGRSLGVLSVPGYTPPDGAPFVFMNWTLIDSGYFATLRIPLVAGRDFSDADRESTQPVAIVSEGAARRFWPGGDAIGKTILSPTPGGPSKTLTVIGVARDLKYGARGAIGRLDLYVPRSQRFSRDVTLLVRTASAGSTAETLRALVASIDPNLPVLAAQTLASQQSGPVDTQLRVSATVAAGIGLIGVLLAAMGTYGVTAYVVTRRTREIAVRLSLGAMTRTVVALALRQGMTLVAVGAGIGCALGLAASQVLARSPLAVPPADVAVLSGAVLLALAVGLTACAVPVIRATRINPMEALREE
jgi:predicted permease